MARYIDADKFLESQIERCGGVMPIIGTCTMDNEALSWVVEKTPTADVVEVKHGKWEKRKTIIFDSVKVGYNCSECNTTWDTGTPYCPNCGAKMDGERKCENG